MPPACHLLKLTGKKRCEEPAASQCEKHSGSIMTSSSLLILAAVFGATLTGSHGAEVMEKSEKNIQSYIPALCSPTPVSSSGPTSVHSLTPADVTALHVLGIPASQRKEASRVLNRLTELLSMLNPDVTTEHVHQTSLQPRKLSKEAQDLALSIAHQETDWKVVLLFVPADVICTCSPQVAEDIKSSVQEVEAALLILQEKLHRTLIRVGVWSGSPDQDKCKCMGEDGMNQRLQRATVLQALQDSLHQLLENPRWQSRKGDFAVVMQSSPVILESQSPAENAQAVQTELALQLWTNLLQPSTNPAQALDIPCPTEERPFLRTQINSPTVTLRDASPWANNLGSDLTCVNRNPSPTTPTSVHELRPGDIKVVATVGDSLTAANGVGAKTDNILLLLTEYRGLSWSIGGDENLTTVTTLPNILREFNPALTGYSTGTGNKDSPNAFLNVAVPGAKSDDMVTQVRSLVEKMKNDARINFNDDWKVITMFIGGNDICDYCANSIQYSARNVVTRISQALDILHNEVPRAIVNLVEMLYIPPLRELHTDPSLGCPTWFVGFICSCIVKPREGSAEVQQIHELNRAYQLAMRDLIDSGRYDTHENFTVVLQPFFRDVVLPRLPDGRPDRSYFAPDCFHLSQKAHTAMAQALWNNMLEPVGDKTFTQNFTDGIELKCPSETNPFIRTAINSNYTYKGPPPTSAPVTNWGSDFSCENTAPSNTVPTSAHKVRPGDIKVVGALGDSLTAGFGARAENLLELRNEDRGVSWSIGGDETLETVTTLPNILKKFNPNIKGMSFGVGKEQTGFNMAISGAKISGIPGQVRTLIDTMKADPSVDFENDWKLVTLFIGGNDLCQYCTDRVTHSPKNYSHHMMTSLDMLYEEVPRVIVNVLEILEIEHLRKIKRNTLGCNLIQQFVCPCFLDPGEDSPELSEVKRANRQMQVETSNLVYGGRYDGREDFAVVVQPFFRNSILPLTADGKPDTTYFSVDCFHFSERGQADMANAVWNNMLEPVDEKQTYNNFRNNRSNIKCPTEEHPYIFTKFNSMPTLSTTKGPGPSTVVPPLSTDDPSKTDCSGKVQAWLAAVLAVVGLLVGGAATGLFFYCKNKRSKKKQSGVEMRGTTF
ncbi:phospholipase B1, membrane-associated [Oryzias latipes]|uniref:phospholipase B1, membrane-associated n=1 Tax=Oryzias latipes TaxID=8090 RepID=UPI0002A4B3A6|nr:phospholipase B1, membrane-associated [Oryzias latipes]